jgi:hypothetical protein
LQNSASRGIQGQRVVTARKYERNAAPQNLSID